MAQMMDDSLSTGIEASIDGAVCPICKTAKVSLLARPFCSTRCADIDLYRWMSGQYSVPVLLPNSGEDAAGLQDSDIRIDGLASSMDGLPDNIDSGNNGGGGLLD